MNIPTSSKVEIKSEVVFRSNKDGTVVVMKMDDDDMFYKINGVAAEMWQLFNEKKLTWGEVTSTLASNYSIVPEKIISDSEVFLEKIIELKLVEIRQSKA